MGRGIRTVQRWHETLHLPVHRINPSGKSPVFAYCEELDQWLQRRAGLPSSGKKSIAASKKRQDAFSFVTLRRWHNLLAYELEQNRLTFMSTDLDAASILIRIAESATDKRKKMRNAANARRALDTVEKLLKESKLSEKEANSIAGKIAGLRTTLERLHAQKGKVPPPHRKLNDRKWSVLGQVLSRLALALPLFAFIQTPGGIVCVLSHLQQIG